MKKSAVLVLTAALMLLSGCGGKDSGGAASAEATPASLWASMVEACGWEEDYMTSLEGEFLEEYYPGLSEIPTEQLVVQIPAMSSDVNEIALIQCETEEDAEAAAAIFQARIDCQVEGGAWYPETMEAWKKAAVLRSGAFVGLIASGEFQEELETLFNQQFS